MSIKINDKYLQNFITEADYKKIEQEVQIAAVKLENKNGPGSEFLGWTNLPNLTYKEEFERILIASKKIRENSDIFIVIGIGGSYLGARAAIEFVNGNMYNETAKNSPRIYYVGNDLNPSTIAQTLKICESGNVSVNVISKSGTTTEPAIAFRIFREYLEKRYGKKDAAERIYITTDMARGKLKELSKEQKYESFIVPDDVGGRFSVLCAVGLLPIAVAGVDILSMLDGAKAAKNYCENNKNLQTNDALKYVAARNILYRKGFSTEVLASYDSALCMTCEWWKQLYGESEGKGKRGIFPASVIFTTDLHSLGQFIQDGSKILFETVIDIKNQSEQVIIPYDNTDCDGLNFIAGKNLHDVNRIAFNATAIAHTDGGTPNIILELNSRKAADFGYLVYFFEYACVVSGYLLGVNPLDQPGVEMYKNNMFALLGKSGENFEIIRQKLKNRI